jgi:hypothetical protein
VWLPVRYSALVWLDERLLAICEQKIETAMEASLLAKIPSARARSA